MRLKRAVVLADVTAAIVIGPGWRPALRADALQEDGYSMLLKLFREFREFQKPAVSESGVPDYTAAAMAAQKARASPRLFRSTNPTTTPISSVRAAM